MKASKNFLDFIKDYKGSPEEKEKLEVFLNDPKNISLLDEHGKTPLHYACEHRYKDLAETLIANGADINQTDNGGSTPLLTACWLGNKEIVEMLTVNGADVNIANGNNGYTPMHFACQNSDIDIVEMLIINGADVNKADNYGWTPLTIVMAVGGMPQMMEQLLTTGAVVPEASLNQIKNQFPAHFDLYNIYDPIVHVNAVNKQFTESLPALLGDAITHASVLPQLIASMYEAAFINAVQENFGEGTKVPVAPWQRQVFEEQAVKLAGDFITIQTFTPSLDTPPAPAASEEEKWQATVSGGKTPTSLFPKPQGRVPCLQEIIARRLGTAIAHDAVETPKPETFALAEELRRAQGTEEKSTRIL